MRIDEFSSATGLDRRTLDALVTDHRVEGMRYTDGRVFGIFDDALPTRSQLHSWGLDVRDDYDPEQHRSYTVNTDDDLDGAIDESEPDDESAGWTMTWGDARS
jgi:hypothetical protein